MAQLHNPLDHLSKEQLQTFRAIAQKRGKAPMYRALFNHPNLAEHIAELGSFLRFQGVLPGFLREFVILLTARKCDTAFIWVDHAPFVKKQNIPEEILQKVIHKQAIEAFPYKQVSSIVDCVFSFQNIPKALQNEMEKELQIEGVIEIVVLTGFYRMIAGFINAFEISLEKDQKNPFV